MRATVWPIGVMAALAWAWSFVFASAGWAAEQALNQTIRGGDIGFTSNFGQSLAIADGIIVAGAPSVFTNEDQDGAAYVFLEPAGGWQTLPLNPEETFHHVKLIASDPSREDKLGNSVAIDGSVIAVGASSKLDAASSLNNAGAVYIYVEPPAGWGTVAGITPLTESAQLTPGEPVSGAFFGDQVVVVGDEIIVSAPGFEAEDDAAERGGALFVFTRPAAGWSGTITPSATLRGRVVLDFDRIGSSLAYDGQTLVAGARFDPRRTPLVYVYERPPGGWVSQVENFQLQGSTGTDNNALDNDGFAAALAVQCNLVVVGAPDYIDPFDPDRGRVGLVQVFQRMPLGWSELDQNLPVASLRSSDRTGNGAFGAAVALSGQRILVGRGSGFVSEDDGTGSAYLFSRPAAGWVGEIAEDVALTAADGASGADFGEAVAMHQDTLLIGASYQGVRARGRAYLGTVGELPVFTDGFEGLR
ncbi:MAG: FG-GAP repeat protein [Pseudomonadota bacterium]